MYCGMWMLYGMGLVLQQPRQAGHILLPIEGMKEQKGFCRAPTHPHHHPQHGSPAPPASSGTGDIMTGVHAGAGLVGYAGLTVVLCCAVLAWC